MRKPNEAQLLQETVATEGWKLVENWFDQADLNMVEALKTFYSVRAEEQAKWINFYAGQAEVLNKFRAFVKNTLEKPLKKEVKKIGL